MTEPVIFERRTRSNSQLSDFVRCGWAFRLKRIYKVPQTPSVWLPGGIAFHSATEEFDLDTFEHQRELSKHVTPELVEHYQQRFHELFQADIEARLEANPDVTEWRTAGRKSKEKPNGEDMEFWENLGPELVAKYIEWRISAEDTWVIATVKGAPAVEVEIKTSTPSDATPLVGYVDRVFESVENGELSLVDLKTGSRMPSSHLQPGAYSVWLEKQIDRPIRWGAYYDARKGRLTEQYDLSMFNEHNIGFLYDRLDRAVHEGNFLPNIDTHCVKCDVRDSCMWQGGREPEARP